MWKTYVKEQGYVGIGLGDIREKKVIHNASG